MSTNIPTLRITQFTTARNDLRVLWTALKTYKLCEIAQFIFLALL